MKSIQSIESISGGFSPRAPLLSQTEWRKAIKLRLTNSERQVLGWGNEFHLEEPFFLKGGQAGLEKRTWRVFCSEGTASGSECVSTQKETPYNGPNSKHSEDKDWQALQKEGTLGSCWGLGGLGLLLAGLWALQVVEGSWARVESPSY